MLLYCNWQLFYVEVDNNLEKNMSTFSWYVFSFYLKKLQNLQCDTVSFKTQKQWTNWDTQNNPNLLI